ncbi:malonyl-CoA:anthocyanidin 5-O-glucoside-6''-O-malonyltransferase [Vigna angularis]|uniref:malonyl-CoA:anthocyanidin 5-O-glucoside-6''-O-malonyltransferase n=1 Tax=Phaseolus angularis TaxID=3914 RepID=UPI00080A44EE|nr:malonyl-CoA:anthocyanidin 5-O-glucoside-6''-O-malonyltransferase [Vigna angularis]
MTEASSPAPLKVIQVCSLAPFQEPTLSTLVPTSLPLTFFDLLWLRFPPGQRLFFYHFPHPTSSFLHSLLPSLKLSLSLTLQHFLPFSGTLTWPSHSPKPIINYLPGDTVSFTVAESDLNFNHLCSHLCEASQRHHLAPHLANSHDKASLLAVQVTHFPNAGFCIGVTTHHAAFDGKSSSMFIKAWAFICSNLQNPTTPTPTPSLPHHLSPIFDRSLIRDPSGLAELYADQWMNHNGSNNRSLKVWESLTATPSDGLKGLFELTPSQIQKLKQYGNSKVKVAVHLSTFSVTCAYVLACWVKANQVKEENVLYIFAVDCRKRLDPPIPATYFGNCIRGQFVLALTKELVGKDGFICALEGIVEALNRVKEEGVLKGAERSVSIMHDAGEVRKISTGGSPLFEVYSIDFGWGRPKKSDLVSADKTRAFSLSESRDISGGIEIGLLLPKTEMEEFTSVFVQGFDSCIGCGNQSQQSNV